MAVPVAIPIALAVGSALAKMNAAKVAADADAEAQRQYAAAILGVPQDMAGERIPMKLARHIWLKGMKGNVIPNYSALSSRPTGDALRGFSGGGGNVYGGVGARAAASGWNVAAQGTNAHVKDAYSNIASNALLGYQRDAASFKMAQNSLLANHATSILPGANYQPLSDLAGGLAQIGANWYLNRQPGVTQDPPTTTMPTRYGQSTF